MASRNTTITIRNLFCDIKLTIFFAIYASMKEKGSTFPYYLNHSLSDRGQPIIRSSASGAPQFAHRSTKSQTGMPTIGRKSAVQKPQNIIHKSATRIGLIKTRIANAISMIPKMKRSCVAVPGSEMPNFANQPIQSFFPCRAKTPWPINSPATAILKTHSISFVFMGLFYYFLSFYPNTNTLSESSITFTKSFMVVTGQILLSDLERTFKQVSQAKITPLRSLNS